jgi:hypothetical protein
MSEETEGSSILSKTTEAVRDAAEAVQATTHSIADAVEAGRRPGAPLDQLARLTRRALSIVGNRLSSGGTLRTSAISGRQRSPPPFIFPQPKAFDEMLRRYANRALTHGPAGRCDFVGIMRARRPSKVPPQSSPLTPAADRRRDIGTTQSLRGCPPINVGRSSNDEIEAV